MIITRRSPIDGNTYMLYLEITQEEIDRWQGGELIQNVWPWMKPSEREFLMTGITPNQWHEMFGKEDLREDYWNDPCEMYDELDEEDEECIGDTVKKNWLTF